MNTLTSQDWKEMFRRARIERNEVSDRIKCKLQQQVMPPSSLGITAKEAAESIPRPQNPPPTDSYLSLSCSQL